MVSGFFCDYFFTESAKKDTAEVFCLGLLAISVGYLELGALFSSVGRIETGMLETES